MTPIKILFVCHGNICRSPMAEFILKDMVNSSSKLKVLPIEIESAAVSREEIGNDIYTPAKAVLRAHGVPFDTRRAWQITPEDYDRFDRIYVMDDSNVRLIKRIVGEDTDDKISMLLDRNVSDPWYSGDFESCYSDIVMGCNRIVEELMNECR